MCEANREFFGCLPSDLWLDPWLETTVKHLDGRYCNDSTGWKDSSQKPPRGWNHLNIIILQATQPTWNEGLSTTIFFIDEKLNTLQHHGDTTSTTVVSPSFFGTKNPPLECPTFTCRMVQEHRDVGVLGGNVAVGRMMGFCWLKNVCWQKMTWKWPVGK